MRRISHTPQGGTTAVNAADGTLMVDQGHLLPSILHRIHDTAIDFITIINYL